MVAFDILKEEPKLIFSPSEGRMSTLFSAIQVLLSFPGVKQVHCI